MRLSFGRASLSSKLPFPILLHQFSFRPVHCSVRSTAARSVKPQIPLFLRPPVFSATLSDLRKWRDWARSLVSSVGSSFLVLDNGPEAVLLCRELNWLIEDAIDDPKALSTEENCGDSKPVALRACLEDLYLLWKQRIEDRRPFQYVVGCEHWRDLVLSVQEGVLIPRPETELIVDLVSDVIEGNERLREGRWADLGTGSGALAIGIGRILGNSGRVIATDISPVAIAVASFNVRRYDLQNKIDIKQGPWFEPLRGVGGELVGIVSNPPYIPSQNINGLQAEVGKYEPRVALDGGANGMDQLLHLCDGVASMLKPGGFFAFETNGEKQCKFLLKYLTREPRIRVSNVKVMSDFAGVQRFLTGFRSQ